jgi:hypothetical protein
MTRIKEEGGDPGNKQQQQEVLFRLPLAMRKYSVALARSRKRGKGLNLKIRSAHAVVVTDYK